MTSHRILRFGIAALLVSILAGPALAQPGDPRFADPAAIDRAVQAFTGVPIGETGGARAPTDRRLRLAACDTPLKVDWHGTSHSTVRVECFGPDPWRIFVATRPARQAARATPVIARGDAVTVVVRGRGFAVQQTGEAVAGGAVGDWIEVRTTPRSGQRGDAVRARIERPGLVVIPMR